MAKGKPVANQPAKPSSVKPVKSKWEGEDKEEEGPVVRTPSQNMSFPHLQPFKSDWEESSEEESEEEPKSAPVAPPKKKGTLKQKLAEKEAEKALRQANGENSDEYDSDAVLDPREKARRDKEKELNADLNNAAELFGAAALGGLCHS